MGLDLVEFVLAIEDAFGIYIPDADAERLLTPLALVDYLLTRVSPGAAPGCLEQRAFYQIRRAGEQVLERPRKAFRPHTPWTTLLHPKHSARQWELLGRAVAIGPWPPLKPTLTWGPSGQTVGQTASTLATTAPGALLRPGEGWERPAVEEVVRRLMAEELGVTEFNWTDRFVADLGCG